VANRGWLSVTLLALIGLTACDASPDAAQLDAWQQEAIAENTRLQQANATTSIHAQWKLHIQGQTQKTEILNWQTLEQLATSRIRTQEPTPGSPAEPLTFRGIPVSALLDRVSATPDAEDVTFLASDSYRATVRMKDLRRHSILLATERDHKLMSRSEGGPLKLVFPSTQFPDLGKRYNDVSWVFYVTHLIVGTEKPQLQAGQKTLKAADLAQFPQTTIKTPVSYRVAWTNGEVMLQGIRIRDLLPLPKTGWVTVRGKSPIHRDPKNPLRLPVKLLRSCDVIIASRWGDQLQPISAQKGGPLTLAFAPSCGAIAKTFPWITFVESLEVTP
jgi:hypothetical protein